MFVVGFVLSLTLFGDYALGQDIETVMQRTGAAIFKVNTYELPTSVAQTVAASSSTPAPSPPPHLVLPFIFARPQETQDWFMNAPDDASPVVVGTIAFGMGLDKKNVRRVFHFNVPRSPEDLAQQVLIQTYFFFFSLKYEKSFVRIFTSFAVRVLCLFMFVYFYVCGCVWFSVYARSTDSRECGGKHVFIREISMSPTAPTDPPMCPSRRVV